MSNTVINPYNFVVGNVGAWKELGRTTLGAEADLISVTGLPNKRYYMLQYVLPKVSPANTRWTFNATTGSEYSSRTTNNGSADSTNVNGVNFHTHADTNGFNYGVSYISNLSTEEKLAQFNETGELGGVGSAPDRCETVGKWDNTSNSISSIQLKNTDTGGFDTGSELVVLGFDPTDTHTTADNFWQELASVNWTSGSSIDSGTFTAKKYLWVQIVFNTGTMSGSYSGLQVGNATIDTGTSYAFRYSEDGGADSSQASKTNAWGAVGIGSDSSNSLNISNNFIINNASNEKLGISHSVINRGDTGAGFAPYRVECVWKWTDTSNQINRIEVSSQAGSGNYTGGTMKVWGSD